MRTKLFIDLEFTGLHQATTPISLGIISECGKTFYAEFTDYDRTQINDWLDENVIANTWVSKHNRIASMGSVYSDDLRWADVHVFGSSDFIKPFLIQWLSQFEEVIIWSDCLAYDWVLFCNIWGHAFNLPKNIYYIPMDICTVFEMKGIDPDISRERFATDIFSENDEPLFFDQNAQLLEPKKHNALWDDFIIRE
jgi:hypothetical protein